MSRDIIDSFSWHSSIGIDDSLDLNKKFVTRLAASHSNLGMFAVAGEDLLVHKTTKALWKFSEDRKTIEPVFGSDILTAEELEALDEEE